MCLGLLQLGDQHAGQATPGSFVLNTLAMAGVAAALTLFVGLPFLDLFLRNMRLDVAWAITLATVFICTAGLAVVAYAYGPGANFWETVVKTFFNFLILFCAYALALSLLRLYGWRLVGRVRQDARQPK